MAPSSNEVMSTSQGDGPVFLSLGEATAFRVEKVAISSSQKSWFSETMGVSPIGSLPFKSYSRFEPLP